MKTVHKSVLIWYSPEEMFRLVVAVEDYPKFLPWCDKTKVLERTDHGMTAEIGIAFSGLHQTFTTRNEHIEGQQVTVKLVNGPFSTLDGVWKFLPVGDGSKRACKIEFDLTYGFSSMTLAALVGPVFDMIAGSMVNAFVKRAEQVYG